MSSYTRPERGHCCTSVLVLWAPSDPWLPRVPEPGRSRATQCNVQYSVVKMQRIALFNVEHT